MFIGHFALGFAAKRVAPSVQLAVLFAAAQLADLLWPVFLALGVEQVRIAPGITAFTPLDFVSYPYSHSLLALAGWGFLLAFVYRFVVGDGIAPFAIIGLVLSHWVLDFITHIPDMPLYPGSAKFGLGLWNSIPGTIVVELAMYAAGLWLYIDATHARDLAGRWAFASLAAVLVVLYLVNISVEPPPVDQLWKGALIGGAVITIWSWWADRHRISLNE